METLAQEYKPPADTRLLPARDLEAPMENPVTPQGDPALPWYTPSGTINQPGQTGTPQTTAPETSPPTQNNFHVQQNLDGANFVGTMEPTEAANSQAVAEAATNRLRTQLGESPGEGESAAAASTMVSSMLDGENAIPSQGQLAAAGEADIAITDMTDEEIDAFMSFTQTESSPEFREGVMAMYMSPAERETLNPRAQRRAQRDLMNMGKFVINDARQLGNEMGSLNLSADALVAAANRMTQASGGMANMRESMLPEDQREQARWQQNFDLMADTFLQEEEKLRMGWAGLSLQEKEMYTNAMVSESLGQMNAGTERSKVLMDFLTIAQRNLEPLIQASTDDPEAFARLVDDTGLEEFVNQFQRVAGQLLNVQVGYADIPVVSRGLFNWDWNKGNSGTTQILATSTNTGTPSSGGQSTLTPESETFVRGIYGE